MLCSACRYIIFLFTSQCFSTFIPIDLFSSGPTGLRLAMSLRVLLTATESWPSAALYCDGLAVTGCEVFALAPKGAPVHSRPSLSGGSVYRPLAALKSLKEAIAKFGPELIV